MFRPAVVVALVVVSACRPPGYGREGMPDASEATVDAPGGSADAAVDAPAAVCEHAFRLDGHGTASSVWLTGSFVGWAGDPLAGAVAFTLGRDGAWTGSHTFAAGPHQYKFIIDGSEWITDPTNPDLIDDGFGGKNSVYTCVP